MPKEACLIILPIYDFSKVDMKIFNINNKLMEIMLKYNLSARYTNPDFIYISDIYKIKRITI